MTTNNSSNQSDIVIIGGGLAGLVNAIHLSKAGLKVLLIEKNEYPKHKVCGEYISNEVLSYLAYLGINPFDFGAVAIDRFELSTVNGKVVHSNLPLGGFGISRYTLDFQLYQKALENGCQIVQDMVESCSFDSNSFKTTTKRNGSFYAKFVIGSFGKRSNLDIKMNRPFTHQLAPYLGVKGHYRGDFPKDLIALHNFKGGYCGISSVEDDLINVCYLADFKTFKKYKNLATFEEKVIRQNPHMETFLSQAIAVFEEPMTISQVSFLSKARVENHLLMSGDSAGMIHPLCGNGMSMAIHSALLLSEILIAYYNGDIQSRAEVEQFYSQKWEKTFSKRLRSGKFFNAFFAQDLLFEWALAGLMYIPQILPHFIKKTHGQAIEMESARTFITAK
ncbi:MAG: NAD(P)/FAD-dependent oxidoreductase [Saprospiraceae bacterium]|nr:NAD(P)/FAD-dependent oxidoreductase [Saprospiraceae bacterium]